jgi:tyrosyl-tRNA synthetase
MEATEKDIAVSTALFGNGDLGELDPATLEAASAEIATTEATSENLGITSLMVATGLAASNSAARRTISEGGAYVNNTQITDTEHLFQVEELIHGRFLIIRKGKKTLAMAVVTSN